MALASSNEGFLTLLKKKHFIFLWLAQLISMTLLNASNFALVILIENATGSTTLIALAIVSFSLPAVLFGAPAGVLVDRIDKRLVMWASNCLRALATLLFVAVLILDRGALLPLYVLTFIIATIGQFFTPAEGAAIPMLVRDQELMPALSLFNITFMISQALGFVIIAPLLLSLLPTFTLFSVTFDSTVQLYIIIALLYIVCSLLILAIPRNRFTQPALPVKTGPLATETLGIMGNVWQETVQGWRFVRQRKPLFRAVVQLSFAGVLILVIGLVATPMVTQLLRQPANNMPLVFAPAGLGLILGSIVTPTISRRLGKSRTILTGLLILTVATLLVPSVVWLATTLQPETWYQNPLLTILVGTLMFIAGAGLDLLNIPSGTAMQELSPNWIKGRVLALQLVFYNACSIPLILFLGALTDLFGIGRVLYLLAAFVFVFALWDLYYGRKHPPVDQDADRNGMDTLPADELAVKDLSTH